MPKRRPRRDRAQRRQYSPAAALQAQPFRLLHSPLAPLELADPEQLEQIHLASMDILENIGLDFFDEEALDIWERAGARVDRRARHVWIDRGLALEAVAMAPERFTWRARNPSHDLPIGGDSIVLAANAGMAYSSNLVRGRRPGTQADLEELIKLATMCNVIHIPGGALVEAQDVPVSFRHLRRTFASFTLSDKALRGVSHGRIITGDDIAMARIVFGDDVSSSPVMGAVVNVNSPLRYDERMIGGLLTYARHGQVSIVTPFILMGAMSPVTIASALAQQNAEALAGIALAQLAAPGAPVIYGGFTTNVDMRSGGPAFSTPEGAWAVIVGAQLARRYRLPYRSSGSLNTAKSADAQAAYETQWSLWPALLSRTNYVHHAAGWLESGLTVSYEKFIIDVENLAMFQHFLGGFEVSEQAFALDMIEKVGPGGHHFGTPHTQARYQDAFYDSFLTDRQGYEPWLAGGGEDTARRAQAIWQGLLKAYQPPPLDPGIREGLAEYVARREEALTGVDLYQ